MLYFHVLFDITSTRGTITSKQSVLCTALCFIDSQQTSLFGNNIGDLRLLPRLIQHIKIGVQ